MLLSFVEESPDLIAKNEQNVRVLEGRPLEGSNIDYLIRNIFVQNSKYNLNGIDDFSQSLSKDNLLNSAIANSKFKQLKTPPMQTQCHTPPISAQMSPALQTPQKADTVFIIDGHKRGYESKDFQPNPEAGYHATKM